ncbi:LacI family DNA-binding transcriptional regulator [Mesoaciditoga lauensis]|uniref:LacI family DNA-binding transcriptional regulator n=1 Tax=Mesoaciditoga lauensis TaxID=1495039 RepID=UPI00056A408E|nr:LacI family DNA-binding transcriptional regulator [Mesoaciditoga lauensis]
MNIREIAKKADVSIATVSRVLNDSKNVSPSTREKVLKILKKYRFEMDPWAKRLASKRNVTHIFIMVSKRILKTLDLKDKEFYSMVVKGIQNTAKANRSITTIVEMETNLDEKKLKGIDGVLLVGGDTTAEHVRFLKKIGMPQVLVDQYIPTVKVDCVVSNGYDGASYAVKYLISQGFKKIVHIHGFLNHFGFKDRYVGYMTTMEQNNLLPKAYEYNDEVMEDMKPLVEKMLNVYGVPEAIFASNDPIAMKVIETLKAFHIKVPDDISVIGFDGIEKGKYFNPPLSTLRVPMQEMGSLALKRLLDIVYGQDVYPVRISLFTEFIKRGSSI